MIRCQMSRSTIPQIPNSRSILGNRDPSSFRDPSGHIYVESGVVLRRINPSYFPQFKMLMESGLYAFLSDANMLVKHELIEESTERKIIRPDQISLITYPYEWCFSQLKDAAILTLSTHLAALNHGMVLKDATAFNIQFVNGKPLFIDTLSFDFYHDNDPWVAYGQFCRHFLAPLLLMKYVAPDLNRLQALYLDGVPLEYASSMLPLKTHFISQIKMNIHMHAKALQKHKEKFISTKKPRLAVSAHKNIIKSMIGFISELDFSIRSEWGTYYDFTNYEDDAFKFKEQIVSDWIKKCGTKKLWDIGGNNGHFARLVKESCDLIVCTDIDPVAVDNNYRECRRCNEQSIVPLVVDYTNPPSSLGFDNAERFDFFTRMKKLQLDCVLALALIHHLSISNNCSFEMLAGSFNQFADDLIIEFVHPTDSWAEKLLKSKRESRHLFDFYNKENFEAAFCRFYRIVESVAVPSSERTLYLMRSIL